MNQPPRPPPTVLFIHTGSPDGGRFESLANAGLRISETYGDTAIDEAAARQPDVIVLDFAHDGDLTERLKAHEATRHIPVIALVDLIRPQ